MSDTLPFQRHSETSREAANRAKGAKEIGEAKVLAVILQHPGGLTDQEILRLTGLSENTARPRRIGLVKKGLVEDSGYKRPTESGCRAVIWKAVRR